MMASSLEFSIIVPTRDRPDQLLVCLESLAQLAYPRHQFEVIVVDDGSRRSIAPAVAPFRSRLDLTLLTQQNAGPATARNAGAAIARGRLLAFTDDDCAPAKDWLQNLAARFRAMPDHMIGGRTINALAGNAYSEASQTLIRYLYDYYNAGGRDVRFLASNNTAFPAAIFRDLGGFDPSYSKAAAEDRDLCDRWRRKGLGMAYAEDAIVYHRHQLRLTTFWQQHFNYGRGAFHFHRVRSGRSGAGLKLEPLAFYLGLLGYPLRCRENRRPLRIAALLLLSQLGNAAGFFREWARQPLAHPSDRL